MATKFGRKNPWPEHNALLGSKVMQGVIQGQPGVKLLRSALWPPNLVGRILDQNVMHCWGQRSWRGQLGSSRGQFAYQCPMATKFGGKNPWPERNALLGSKVIHGSAKVNQRSNSLEMPCGHQILVEMTPDQSVMHWWGQRSCKGQLGSTRGKIWTRTE